MKNITTYYSTRTNYFVWMAALLSLASAVARFFAFKGGASDGFWVALVRIILPLAANLLITVRLPWRCEHMYYVTIAPVFLLTIYFVFRVCIFGINAGMTIACLLLCALQLITFSRTFKGKMNSKLSVLGAYLMPLFFSMDPQFRVYFTLYMNRAPWMIVSDVGSWLCIVCIILAAKKMPQWQEGEEYRRRYKDRMDGRLLRSLPPMAKLEPYFMPKQSGSVNYISQQLDVTTAERYIHEKRMQGMKHFGFMHLLLAAYTRTVAEYPGLNRFVSGRKIYSRYELVCSMDIKKDMTIDNPDTMIKIHLKPGDTAAEVYEKFDALVQGVKESDDLDSAFDGVARLFDSIPGLLLAAVLRIIRTLDYMGLVPAELLEFSPFHASLFLTSMGSLGLPPVYHHLYDFGNAPVFCSFGARYSRKTKKADGTEESRKYIDLNWSIDDRTCDGFYYAAVMKRMKYLIAHPELLDEAPETVVQDIE